MLGRKKSRAPLNLRALRQAVGLTHGSGHPSSFQDLPLAPSIVETHVVVVVVVVVVVTHAPPPPLAILVQEVAPAVEVDAPAVSTGLVVAPPSTVIAPLLSVKIMCSL